MSVAKTQTKTKQTKKKQKADSTSLAAMLSAANVVHKYATKKKAKAVEVEMKPAVAVAVEQKMDAKTKAKQSARRAFNVRFAQELRSIPYETWRVLTKWQRSSQLGSRYFTTELKGGDDVDDVNEGSDEPGSGGGQNIVITEELRRAVFPRGPLVLDREKKNQVHEVLHESIRLTLDNPERVQTSLGGSGGGSRGGSGGGGGGQSEEAVMEQKNKQVEVTLGTKLEASLRAYSAESSIYSDLNGRLREGKSITCWRPYIDCLVDACHTLPPVSRGVLFRGVNKARSRLDHAYDIGTCLVWTQFVSCSVSADAALKFADPTCQNKGVIFRILTNEGVHISPWSVFPEEDEVLLKPPFIFHVMSVATDGAPVSAGGGGGGGGGGGCDVISSDDDDTLVTITIKQCGDQVLADLESQVHSTQASSSISSSSSTSVSIPASSSSSSSSTSALASLPSHGVVPPPPPLCSLNKMSVFISPKPHDVKIAKHGDAFPVTSSSSSSTSFPLPTVINKKKAKSANPMQNVAVVSDDGEDVEAKVDSAPSGVGGGGSGGGNEDTGGHKKKGDGKMDGKSDSQRSSPTGEAKLAKGAKQQTLKKRGRERRTLLIVDDVQEETDTLLKRLNADILTDVEILRATSTNDALALALQHRDTLCGIVTDMTRTESRADETVVNNRAGLDLAKALRDAHLTYPICLYYTSATFHATDLTYVTSWTVTTREDDVVNWIHALFK
jgi:hypothetical protein